MMMTPRQINQHIGGRFRNRRLTLGKTLHDVAPELDVSFQQVQKYETGQSGLSAVQLLHASTALRTGADFFYVGLPGAENVNEPTLHMRDLRAFIARWGLDHPDEAAQEEARALLNGQ